MGQGATTGTCAAAAAKAAALHARGGLASRRVDIPLPGSGRLSVDLLAWGGARNAPWASVRKPSNGDPDATREAVVVVSLRPGESLLFRAGPGVGTVTRAGLQLAPGEPAINPGPRRQIAAALREAGSEDWIVTVSVQGGQAIARNTFNPRLGIVGGISILGTAGIVRPWSMDAFVASTLAHMGVVRARGQETLLVVPGHMGERAAATLARGLEPVEVGNAWGAVLDRAAEHGFTEIVAVGHPGKLVKLAQGQWDTHCSAGSSACSWAHRFLRRSLSPSRAGQLAPSDTLEGLLVPLPESIRREASEHLATRAAKAIGRRAGMPARVLFVDLKGKFLGEGMS
ncbi:MAG TPA: cobalt-precorrin-5B (C(1))-methyltransferase CbiD [Fibrobacteria bacterium]|nr:cobalt-precorrin-5B (C(1))-methyltransferase CbiD [Fibrobacteria bacterium]